MNAPFQVAQAIAAAQGSGAPQVVKIVKPEGKQALTIELGYQEQYKLDLSGVANEKLVLVHQGENLVILFDNQSTITVHPVFDSMKVLGNITFELAPGRVFTGDEVATVLSISDDQSLLPAAGDAPGARTGAHFSDASVDPLSVPNPLDLLGPEELPPIQFGQSDARPPDAVT